MKIGMIGSGNVGSALGRVWARAGHQVMFSSRHLEDDKRLAADIGANARAGTPGEAAAFGDVLVFAVPYGALPELGRDLRESIKGKVVIDACNPFPHRDGEIAERARETGAGLMTAELLPGARIVRAFNAIGADRMGKAHEQPGRVGMPIAGDDEKSLDIASRLIREIGYEPVRIGGLEMGKYLMPGTPLAGERTPEEIRKIIATLRPGRSKCSATASYSKVIGAVLFKQVQGDERCGHEHAQDACGAGIRIGAARRLRRKQGRIGCRRDACSPAGRLDVPCGYDGHTAFGRIGTGDIGYATDRRRPAAVGAVAATERLTTQITPERRHRDALEEIRKSVVSRSGVLGGGKKLFADGSARQALADAVDPMTTASDVV